MEKLPNEIQQLVFKHLRDNNSNILECVLVCKSWKSVYQKLLYSNVQLSTFSQLQNFFNTLQNNQHLCYFVVKLTLQLHNGYRSHDQFVTFEKLSTRLTNLEYIDCCHFSILLDALLANQLPKLNYVKPPSEEQYVDGYAACALVLKDRLRYLSIRNIYEGKETADTSNETFDDQSGRHSFQYYRLYNRIEQFKNIQELHIEKENMNIIDFLDNVTQICPTLRQLKVEVNEYDNANMVNMSDEFISNTTPALNVTSLFFLRNILYSSQNIHYIIKKFPRLERLEVLYPMHYSITRYIPDLMPFLDESTINKLVDYLMKLKFVEILEIRGKADTLLNTIGRLWAASSQSHLISVILRYSVYVMEFPDVYDVGIKMNYELCKSRILFSPEIHFPHKTILEMYGCLIDQLDLSLSAPTDEQKHMLFELLFIHPLKHCAKLKKLIISANKFGPPGLFYDKDFGNRVLDTLRIENCQILSKEIVFKRISGVFSYLKNLELINIDPVVRPKPRERCTEIRTIEMAGTDIGTFTLTKRPAKWDCEKTLVLLHLTTELNSSYYKYDFPSMDDLLFKKATENHYLKQFDRPTTFVIGFKCKSVKSIRVTHLTQVISLELL